MPSETDLLNEALARIGAPRIGAIDDPSINAQYCATLYPGTRDALLRMNHWNFASGRAVLQVIALDTPVFEFNYAYQLPADFLKLREYYGGPVAPTNLELLGGQWTAVFQNYVIENGQLLSNNTTARITYTRRVTDCNLWDPLFYQVCATWLAGKLADVIPKDSHKSRALIQEAMTLHLPAALAADGQEGTVFPLISDSLTWGR